MDELARELSVLRDDLSPHWDAYWDEARSERLYLGVGRLRRRRQVQRLSAAVVSACLLAAVSFGALRGREVHDRAQAAVALASRPAHGAGDKSNTAAGVATVPAVKPSWIMGGEALRLSDGSHVQLVSTEGELDVVGNESMRIDLRLRAGTAHFAVVPNHERHFVVDAGPVQVAVVGTVFDVERAEGRVRVAVVEGKVRVTAADGVHMVGAGEMRWFDDVGAEAIEEAPGNDAPVMLRSDQRVRRAHGVALGVRASAQPADGDAPRASTSWRSLTQAGDYEAAYRALSQGAAVGDDPAALMDAADASRLSEHPEAAVTYLRRVVREHRGSPVAPLAAFTLGRVLLERLGQPSEAAESFAQARTLAPHGSLAQDALAREVEALSKAGQAHDAYLRARQYREQYPAGRRLRAVQLYGGLE